MNFLRQNNPKGTWDRKRLYSFFRSLRGLLDNSNASAMDKNKILSAVSVLNKTGIPFKS